MSQVNLDEILRLPVEERIDLVERIWDSIAANADAVPVTREQREELQRRMEEHERNPEDVVEWSDVEERIRSRLKQ